MRCVAIVTVGERVPSLIETMQRGALPHCILIRLVKLLEGRREPRRSLELSAQPAEKGALTLVMYAYGSAIAGTKGMGGRLNELCGAV
ncbi:hypothetical protein CUR178_08488 [Leishmania enriettii]|uniref:Uncharacterized protein n=1 Tax=Leishmania enriettii TaxID=5663 RepID=A0A836KVM1_LEIEN|nr:hypothetical protein CUR178_08488 [Leishmania enriettii]